jgi:hypothetical protein
MTAAKIAKALRGALMLASEGRPCSRAGSKRPTAPRSPIAIRRTVDELGKRSRRRAAGEQSPELADFLKRFFRDDDVGGHA